MTDEEKQAKFKQCLNDMQFYMRETNKLIDDVKVVKDTLMIIYRSTSYRGLLRKYQ